MARVDQRDLVGGIAIALLGGSFYMGAQSLPQGTAGQIGPGFVPSWVGLITVGLGVLIAGRAFLRSRPLPRVEIRPVLAIFAAVAVFGVLIRSTGLAPALFGTTVVAAVGSPMNRPLGVLALAVFVALGCCAIFILVLGLPMVAFRSPF